jgi:rhodanese-related sulfurtransferase
MPSRRVFLLRSLLSPSVIAAAGLLAGGPSAWSQGSPVVSLDQARAEHEAGKALLVDIREPDEHATGELGARLAELPRDRPVLLICNTQNRSRATLDALRQQGWTNLRYVHGGMSEWTRRQWPTVKPAR